MKIHIAVGLLVVYVVTTDASGATDAHDPREAVKVAILPGEESAQEIENSLVQVLADTGFDATVSPTPNVHPRDFLKDEPDFDHAVVILPSSDDSVFEGKVYTRGTLTPKVLNAKTDFLVDAIRTYLTSREVVRIRVLGAMADPDSTDDPTAKYRAFMNRGLSLMLKQEQSNPDELDQAIACFTAAQKLQPDHPSPHFNLALAFGRKGDHERRKEHVKLGLEIDPSNPDLRNEEAILLMREERFEEALTKLKRIPQHHPTIKWNMAYALSRLGRDVEAKETLGLVTQLEASERIQTSAERLSAEIDKKNAELAVQKKWLSTTKRSLWIAMLGLGSVAVVGVIVLTIRGTTRQLATAAALKPEDRLALRVQIGMTTISGAFSILSLTLGLLLG